MTSFGVQSDSFEKFDELYNLLYRPLSQVKEICGGDVFGLKQNIGLRIQSLKGEIRKNCQAHSKRKDAEIYLRSIKSKLKDDLLNHLLGKEVDSEYQGNPIYHTTDRTPNDQEFINEIRASFDSIFKFLGDLLPEEAGNHPIVSKHLEKNRRKPYIQSYTLDPDVNVDSFINSFQSLRGKVISEDTTDEQFMACFSGGPVLHKVSWKRQNALYYFITRLNLKELIVKIPNGIWETAALCFTDKNGNPFDPGNLGRTKSPSLAKCRKIDNAIHMIKKTRE